MLVLSHHSPFTDRDLLWLVEGQMAIARQGGDVANLLEYLAWPSREDKDHITDRYRRWLLTTEHDENDGWFGGAAALSLTAAEELRRVCAPQMRVCGVRPLGINLNRDV